MKIGFYAGSFDPFTFGHLNIVKQACLLFDEVVVGIGYNVKKSRVYDINKMKLAIEQTFKQEGITNVKVVVYNTLTVDCAITNKADFLVRGIRNGTDYEMEENLAIINEELSGLKTIYFRAGKFGAISSSMVKELIANKKEVSKYVPAPILKIIEKNK